MPDFSVWKPFAKAASVHEVALGAAYASVDDNAIRELVKIGDTVVKMVANDKLDAMVSEVEAFSNLPKALMRLKDREVSAGKIVVAVAN